MKKQQKNDEFKELNDIDPNDLSINQFNNVNDLLLMNERAKTVVNKVEKILIEDIVFSLFVAMVVWRSSVANDVLTILIVKVAFDVLRYLFSIYVNHIHKQNVIDEIKSIKRSMIHEK